MMDSSSDKEAAKPEPAPRGSTPPHAFTPSRPGAPTWKPEVDAPVGTPEVDAPVGKPEVAATAENGAAPAALGQAVESAQPSAAGAASGAAAASGSREIANEVPSHPGPSLSPPGTVPESDVRTHSPAAAAPPREQAAFDEHLGELPSGYGDGRLVCMVRDPSTLFVYWDLSRQHIEQAFGGLGSAQAILKLWALRGEVIREYPVHLEARGWYLRDLAPGSEFRVELWAAGEKGARLLRSGRPVRLPPAAPSGVLEEFYAVLPVGVPLPRDGQLSGGRPLDWKAGAQPPVWERRLGTRLGAARRSSSDLPWSGTAGGLSDPLPDAGEATADAAAGVFGAEVAGVVSAAADDADPRSKP